MSMEFLKLNFIKSYYLFVKNVLKYAHCIIHVCYLTVLWMHYKSNSVCECITILIAAP